MLIRRFISSVFIATFLLSNYLVATESTLENSVAQLMKVAPKQIELKQQTKGMTSAKSYAFELGGKKYIVKMFAQKHNSEYRKKEIEVTKIFSDLELGAKLIAVGDKDAFYIREYIPGRTLEHEDLQDKQILENLAKSVRKLHEYKYAEKARGFLERAEKHYKSIMQKKIATPTGFEKSYEKFKELMKGMKISEGFCHNDLNPLNIVLTPDKKIYFIDFGNSGCNNVNEELGYVTLLNGIIGAKLEQFLSAYYNRKPTTDEVKRVQLFQKLLCFVSTVVYLDFSEDEQDKTIGLKQQQKKLDKLQKSYNLEPITNSIKRGEVVSVKSRNKDLVKSTAMSFYKEFLDMK